MIGCLEAEFRHSPILTVRTVRGGVEGMNQFGAVVYVRNDRADLQRMADLKDKIVTASFFGLMEQQWRTLEDKGVSLFSDIAQALARPLCPRPANANTNTQKQSSVNQPAAFIRPAGSRPS